MLTTTSSKVFIALLVFILIVANAMHDAPSIIQVLGAKLSDLLN